MRVTFSDMLNYVNDLIHSCQDQLRNKISSLAKMCIFLSDKAHTLRNRLIYQLKIKTEKNEIEYCTEVSENWKKTVKILKSSSQDLKRDDVIQTAKEKVIAILENEDSHSITGNEFSHWMSDAEIQSCLESIQTHYVGIDNPNWNNLAFRVLNRAPHLGPFSLKLYQLFTQQEVTSSSLLSTISYIGDFLVKKFFP